jgi:hypothetical protein
MTREPRMRWRFNEELTMIDGGILNEDRTKSQATFDGGMLRDEINKRNWASLGARRK